jgi:hypothetical protein
MTVPLCHKCASAELKPFIMCGVTVYHMTGCEACEATSYEEARTMCPLINHDLIDVVLEKNYLNDVDYHEKI